MSGVQHHQVTVLSLVPITLFNTARQDPIKYRRACGGQIHATFVAILDLEFTGEHGAGLVKIIKAKTLLTKIVGHPPFLDLLQALLKRRQISRHIADNKSEVISLETAAANLAVDAVEVRADVGDLGRR